MYASQQLKTTFSGATRFAATNSQLLRLREHPDRSDTIRGGRIRSSCACESIRALVCDRTPVELLDPGLFWPVSSRRVLERLRDGRSERLSVRLADMAAAGSRHEMTRLIVGVRGRHHGRAAGERLERCDPEAFAKRREDEHPRRLHESEHLGLLRHVRAEPDKTLQAPLGDLALQTLLLGAVTDDQHPPGTVPL